MTEKIQDEKPCLVETPQGFSVFYRNKFLYSKYAPQKAICQTIQNLTVLPGTLFLCCSPLLSYGLSELLEKLDDSSFCLLCEFDSSLSDFSKARYSLNDKKMMKAARLSLPELQSLPVILNQPSYTTMEGVQLLPAGSFKRVVRIDFSAGVQFHKELYDQLSSACSRAIMTFWANRMTLVKFGRKYSQNFFKNLNLLAKTTPIQGFFRSVTKPLIVFGAGESTNEGIRLIKNAAPSSYYILCADTALQPLLASGIHVDGVFIEEAQTVIKKAFIGAKNKDIQIFAGMSAVSNLSKITKPERISFFTTKYADVSFLDNLLENEIIPPANEPFGSVGLTAVYYALKFRADASIPVFLYGLDFSYSAGLTHAKGSMAHTQRLISQNRLYPPSAYSAAFSPLAEKVPSKDGRVFYTTRTLKNYAELFNGIFCGEENLFDAADSGIKLNIMSKKPTGGLSKAEKLKQGCKAFSSQTFSDSQRKDIKEFLFREKEALERLRDVLTGKEKLSPLEQKEYIIKEASSREYLFLHFPDGISFKYETSFLKRIRTEIDFFLKFF